MKFVLTICLSIVVLSFNNCTTCSCKKVPCPAFNDPNFSAWFPYSTDQQITFQNSSSSDTITLYVEKSQAYEAKQGCYGASGGCIADCYIYSNELSSAYNRKLQITMTQPGNLSFNLYQFDCQSTNITDTGLVLRPAPVSSNYYPSLNIGNKVYNNVQLIKKDTIGSNSYSGLTKFSLQKTWELLLMKIILILKRGSSNNPGGLF